MNPQTQADTIYPLLQQTETAVLATHRRDGSINARFMLFACDPELKCFYLVTQGSTDKLAELARDPGATLSALFVPAGQTIDKAAETVISGRVATSQDFGRDWVKRGLQLLAKKFPSLSGLYESGSLGDYHLIRLDASEVVFQTYENVMRAGAKTVLSFPS